MGKKFINSILALSIAILVLLGAVITVDAAGTADLEYGWTVTYNGNNANAFTTDYDINKANLLEIMPGDTVVYSATYANATDKPADFYLNTKIFNTLEDNSAANSQGGAYTFKIEDQKDTSTTILYNNIVGGDATTTDPVGLKQLKAEGDSYFSLGKVEPGKSGKIVITVAIDGNAQDDSYMVTLAKLSIVFAAESVTEPTPNTIINEGNHVVRRVAKSGDGKTEVVLIDDAVPTSGDNPITGDTTFPLIMCAICLAVGLLFVLWYFKLTKEQKEEA